nr:PREDICTED: HORMA domain-containing protein 1 [Anolis carolinensis]|eukprot:XP_016853996.1 PREDICTED: HORMA domain-containing protein 1 [Anolis carolinensis]
MATAQKQRTSLSTAIFPNKITTEQQSLVLVKRLLAIAVSCITYLRGIFPECAYGTRYLDDFCVKILREDKNCPSSSQLVKWMLGCYDALQKKYLRLLMLAVYTDQEDPETITECYQFKFKYTDHGPSMDFTSKNPENNSNISCVDTKKASILLIRKIYVLMQNLGPLPDDVCLTMKLFYYDEITPADYQPPGFKEGECQEIAFEGEPTFLNVGEVPTPFHKLKVKVMTEKERMERVDKTILRQSNTLTSPKACYSGGQEQEMDEDFIGEDRIRQQKTARQSLCSQEINLIYEEHEEENRKREETSNVSNNNAQVTQLINKTSALEVAESKTRSGKQFQGNTVGVESESSRKPLPAARAKKRASAESGKPVYHFDFSSSQNSGCKRRKISEPKKKK